MRGDPARRGALPEQHPAGERRHAGLEAEQDAENPPRCPAHRRELERVGTTEASTAVPTAINIRCGRDGHLQGTERTERQQG